MGGGYAGMCVCVCVCVCYMRVLRGAGRKWRCSCVGGVDGGGGCGGGCLAGCPGREGQQSLMISGSERGGDAEGERKTEMRNEREKGYLWISQPSVQKGGGVGAAVVLEG